jgi:peptidoglycan/xylan/chitin deacetylase (PgdA/CDA1 family)
METGRSDARTYREAFPPPQGVARFRQIARGVALSIGSRLVPPRDRGPSLRPLYCHFVFDEQLAAFEALLGELQRIGRFVDTATVIRIARGEMAVEETLFHLSFDDGFRNVVTNALPVLQQQGVPAIVFVPTALLDNPSTVGIPRSPPFDRMEMASWTDMERALAMGFEVGSHTRTHARLSDISHSDAVIEDEICGSKADIERRLGSCRYISWPYGRMSDSNARSLDAVRRAGFEACFGAFRGRVLSGVTDPFRIPRHHIEANWPLSHVRYFAAGAMEREPA